MVVLMKNRKGSLPHLTRWSDLSWQITKCHLKHDSSDEAFFFFWGGGGHLTHIMRMELNHFTSRFGAIIQGDLCKLSLPRTLPCNNLNVYDF